MKIVTRTRPASGNASQAITFDRLMMTTEKDTRPVGRETMQPETRTNPGELSVYDSARLFRGSTEIGIEHDGAIYRLKITRQGKLILNK